MSEYALREAEENELEALISEAENYLPHSISRNRNNLTTFWNPNEISREEAKLLLKSLPNWNWTEPTFFSTSSLITLNEIEHILLGEDGLGKNKLTLLRDDGNAFKLIHKTKLQNLRKIDSQFFLTPLDESFCSFVYMTWMYSYSNSYEGVYSLMKDLPTIGAFIKNDTNASMQQNGCQDHRNHDSTLVESHLENTMNNESTIMQNNCPCQKNHTEEPVSFAATRYYGEIGFTYTYPKYQNRGLATAVTAALADRLLELNITPFVTISHFNTAAVRAHEKIGFEKYCPIGYHLYVTEGMEYNEY